MLTVTQIDYIKHLREIEDASISEIATVTLLKYKNTLIVILTCKHGKAKKRDHGRF